MLYVLKKIFNILDSQFKLKFFTLIFLFICGSVFDLIGLGMLMPLLVRVSNQSSFETDNIVVNTVFNIAAEYSIYEIGVFIIFIFIVKNIFISFIIYLREKFQQDVNKFLTNYIFKKILHKPYNFFYDYNSSFLINLVTNDTRLISKTLTAYIEIFVSILVMSIFIFLILFTNYTIGIILISFVFVILFFTNKLLKKYINFLSKERAEIDKNFILNLQEAIYNIKIIQILNKFNFFLKKINFSSSKWSRNMTTWNFFSYVIKNLLETISVILIIFALFMSLYLNENLTSAFLFLSLLVLSAYKIFPLLNVVVQRLNTINYGLPIMQKIIDVSYLIYDDKNQEKLTGNKKILFNKSIEIKNIYFSYDSKELKNKKQIINNLSFTIRKGQIFAICGKSGSGKSTLIDIIMGITRINNGFVEVDGTNICENIKNWQSKIGYVPQKIFLHDDTIMSNILLGEELNEENEKKINDILKICNLDTWVKSLKDGIFTSLGEQAIKISGGQVQRIGIARALLHSPEILVLDEATSALDLETEKSLLENLKFKLKNKTIIIISHRENVTKFCDNFLNLNKYL